MKKIFLYLAGTMLIFSCNNSPKGPDVSGIQADFKLERFEKDFFEIDTNNLRPGLLLLQKNYPGFYFEFMNRMLSVSGEDTNLVTQSVVKEFYSIMKPLNDSLQLKYKSMAAVQNEITDGFKHVKYYFPDYKIPGVITYVSTLDAPAIALTPHHIAIGLHLFGGKNFSAYQQEDILQLFPRYISRRFDEEYIAAGCIKAIAEEMFPPRSTGKPLIEQMIEKGKQWWLIDLLLPGSPDSVKTGYTQQQLDWCSGNESEIWTIILKSEELNSINPEVIQTYIGEGPFTQGFSQENSPGNLGPWFGWQIVKKFAEKNPGLKPGDIMNADARKILDEAKYKPR